MTTIKQDDNIVFIGGCQRSGTTLMRNILNQHPLVKIAYENAFYKLLFKKYRDGVKNKNGKILTKLSIEDVKKLIENGTINKGMIPKTETAIKEATAFYDSEVSTYDE